MMWRWHLLLIAVSSVSAEKLHGESLPPDFALAGRMETDGDGMSDFSRARSSIERAGGNVVAVCTEAGSVWGRLTESTRYPVIGMPPDKDSEARATFVAFVTQAKNAGIEIVPLSRLLMKSNALDAAALVEPGPPPRTFRFAH